jgi:O-antigen/teichoic acid export membrane protein
MLLFDLVGKPLFVWVNGVQYERSFDIFVILSFGIWFSLMFSPLINILIARRDFRFLFLLGAIGVVVSLAGNYLLVPLFGGMGAAISIVSYTGFINLTANFRARRSHDSRN